MSRFLLMILIGFGGSLGACTDSSATTTPAIDGKVRVLATIAQIADAARVVGGEHVEVRSLMGPGVDPHLYKASAGDLTKLRNAHLVLYNGKGLEGKMADVLVKLARQKSVRAVTENIPASELLEPAELEGHYDPHVWFDTRLWSMAVDAVRDALVEIAPQHGDVFRANAKVYCAKLAALGKSVRERIATIPKAQRVLITSHDAFRYFGRAYNLEVRGLQGISTVTQAGVKDIQDLAAFIVKREIKAVFVETSVRSKEIRAVQKAVANRGFDVRIGGSLFSDAMGSEPPTNTYVGMMEHNVRTLVEALR